jgi:hypothetical protein
LSMAEKDFITHLSADVLRLAKMIYYLLFS